MKKDRLIKIINSLILFILIVFSNCFSQAVKGRGEILPSSYIKSNLCFALSDKVEGPYHYEDTQIYSGFTSRTLDRTNLKDFVDDRQIRKYLNFSNYNNSLWPNAIDPALFYDKEGRLWMSYGSWSGGIFILEIDQKTGYPIHPEKEKNKRVDPYFGKHLAGGFHNSIEGPYILYDSKTEYYFLFVSYGSLTSSGGYQIRLFRSKNSDGPYVDKTGNELDRQKAVHHPYGVKLMGNWSLPSLLQAYMAPGHNSAIINEKDEILLVHHVRFDDGSEYHEPRVRRLFRTTEDWLTAAPFAYSGKEKVAAGLKKAEITGTYYILNHGTSISPKIETAEPFLLKRKGTILDSLDQKWGRWEYNKKSGEMKIENNSTTFKGVLIKQTDEGGGEVTVFSLLSDNNESVWGIRYD